jgi:hypothetical protein
MEWPTFPSGKLIKSVNQAGLRGVMPRDYVYRIAGRQHWSFCMKGLSCIAAAVAAVTFVTFPAGVVLAQNAPNTGAETITSAPAAAAPAATTPPAATPPATTATPAPAKATTADPVKGPKKKKAAKMTRQQEIDKSVDSGTVPARYRNSVPKQYQQYIPFEKR